MDQKNAGRASTAADLQRMHCVDKWPCNGPVILMLHDQPSWSYL
jgi:hypothetical protein